ncbi:baseplate assembly protein [Pseudomonas fluorescens]|uniref:Baseplate J/gp47 family protein n=1 Tax=Pseudomonas fluorescens TaxID=294 RepID=A0A944HFF3_PSEFL|nr:baseplate J/gp47 family protein [Pseudomonas fluorescens]MBT2294564.1 baseplate J/gp47 family protein [Pseudomonas fluorescens]MBT2306780.1 baseplate J/gp47 family protein [Pseudomonas fluorescens]MBT2316310.1 baseplate J/gp47 family protein [Pseudomonas fluorescens]MBT2331647.1 baseplate J/gp47 family protein [Pseudomonas fluorescens]MBT2342815.1 baseplate J/gp47 family protein [Pseudomonas fluorescens]
MRELPKPIFIAVDPAATEAKLIARYEEKSGKTLYPAQVERLFIDQIAYAVTRQEAAVQNAGQQLLVRFAKGPILDYLGELVATPRLLAVPARCVLRFSMPAAVQQPLLIRAGTKVSTQDGKLIFLTDQDVAIPAGQTAISATATCLTAGVLGNGWAAGQISNLVNAPAAGMTATNTTTSAEGAEDEEDDRYRERIILAPEAFSNAGSRGAYRYHALAVHQSITDVAVHGPDEGQPDGHVAVFPLTSTGLPSAELLESVRTRLSGEKVRPLCDTVHAYSPLDRPFQIKARLTFYAEADRAAALAAAHAAAYAYAQDRRAGLGRDIVREQLTALLQVSGVYRAELEHPDVLSVLETNEWANCSAIELIDAGVAIG